MSQETVVILIHGINTAAWWQNRVATILEREAHASVIPLKYGYFDLLRFLCPFRICRNGPIERLRKQIEGIREQHRGRRLVVFAHSYGTYALSKILLENAYFTFDRIILCGSIIKENFDWSRVESQILSPNKREAIINECGTRDVWPVIAKSVSWDYGASGTYGFGAFNVRDRFHPFRHSEFFDDAFVRDYWIPAVTGQPIAFSPVDAQGAGAPFWFGLFRMPLRWLVALAVPVVAIVLALPLLFPSPRCPAGSQLSGDVCVNVQGLKSRKEIAERISTLLVDINKTLDIKSGDLFPAMRQFQAQPTAENWNTVLAQATRLLAHVEKSLDDIMNYDSHLVKDGENVILITSDGRVAIEGQYWRAFEEAKSQFKGRTSILTQMRSAVGTPNPDRVGEWLRQLEQLHDKLRGALSPLVNLLDRA